MKPAIIVPAYKRENSLRRLLKSINNAVYPTKNIELIISLDGDYTSNVLDIAESFQFLHGSKKVIKRKNNIGLREHILWCGDQTEKYGSVIILEDDLIVSNQYYNYTKQALEFYSIDDNISGISLYGHKYNEYAYLPFDPNYNGYSGYFMQIASSWGQAWSQDMWFKFKQWYNKNDSAEAVNNINGLPDILKKWPESSWKKYFSAYLVKENKYFYYPYRSHTTNCSDKGGYHIKGGSDLYQVPISFEFCKKNIFSFQKYTSKSIRYDSFMEPNYDSFYKSIGFNEQELCVDMYGIKPLNLINQKKYIITSRKCKNSIKLFELKYKPIDNVSLGEVEIDSNNTKYVINLSKCSDLINLKQPYYKLVKYYSYTNLESKKFLKKYALEMTKKIYLKFKI